ncbi:DUF418 domain-containing protein [Massilia sp. GCM10020059]|uniref:DUF418 domain-containing protein n=1 Tax=Massilia agrisoli TaxID=2892444 RepID=A0ABS8IQG8_9BURK|nr:DUF418 domain-containing protein [Massilia agrisoli]MCC6070877.1 DUF418 domain-containing protein [Massilia agrisoli]
MGAPSSTRSARIDALRGLAVFGILLINVWGFVYGYTALRYGVVEPSATTGDRLAVFFAAAFAEQKFYPIFAFLFGAGFSLQMRSLEQKSGLEGAKAIYLRRLKWLLVVGVLHGTLLWFGDILTSYALTAFWLLRRAGESWPEVRRSIRFAVIVNVAMLLLTAGIMATIANMPEYGAETAAEALLANEVYTHGRWLEVTMARIGDFGLNIGGFWLFVPRIALLFLLGVAAVQLGWLTHPEQHRALWRRILLVGVFIALPLNVWWGYEALSWALEPETSSRSVHMASLVLELAGPALAAAYVAVFMLAGQRAMDAVARWLAPVGRMALTNYLGQSLACGLLLQAYGLGLGAVLSRAELMGLSAAIMLAQVLVSRWWMSGHDQGPAEALWRRYTYRR